MCNDAKRQEIGGGKLKKQQRHYCGTGGYGPYSIAISLQMHMQLVKCVFVLYHAVRHRIMHTEFREFAML